MLVKCVGFMRVIGLQKLLTFDAIRLVLGIYRQKPQLGIFPKNFRSPLAPKLRVRLKKKSEVQKWYGHPLSSCKVWWRSAVACRREKETLGVFVFFCRLFVCHSLDLEQRFSHSNSDIVANCR